MSKNKKIPTAVEMVAAQSMTLDISEMFGCFSSDFMPSEKERKDEIRKEKSAKKKKRISERRETRKKDNS